MMEFLSQIKPYLENLYYVAALLLAIIGVISLRQIFLIKYDIKTRNLRAANREAMALIDRYVERFVWIYNRHYHQMKQDNAPDFKGEVGDFCSMDKINLEKTLVRLRKGKHWGEMLNELEIIAAGVNSRLANEDLAFNAFGKSFCDTVKSCYDIICSLHIGGAVKYLNNVVDLYQRWDRRIKRIELEFKKGKIDGEIKKIAKIGEEKLSAGAIGTDLE